MRQYWRGGKGGEKRCLVNKNFINPDLLEDPIIFHLDVAF